MVCLRNISVDPLRKGDTEDNNNNKEMISDNYGRLQDLILLFKIRVGTRKCLFEIYRQFGHAPSKRFASPELDDREGGLISSSGKHVSLCHCIQTGSYT
jgi:hypothetical protein